VGSGREGRTCPLPGGLRPDEHRRGGRRRRGCPHLGPEHRRRARDPLRARLGSRGRLDHQGSQIAVGAGTGDIYLYDDASAEPSITLAGHRGRVLILGFSADDASLVSAAADGTARRWTLDGQGGSAQVRVDASAQCASYDLSTGHAAVASAAGTLLLRVADPA
jgi:hypothetical protein